MSTKRLPSAKKAIAKSAIADRALLRRINSRLAHDGERMFANRSLSRWPELGRYYVVDNVHTGNLSCWGIDDLEGWAHRYLRGVIAHDESVLS